MFDRSTRFSIVLMPTCGDSNDHAVQDFLQPLLLHLWFWVMPDTLRRGRLFPDPGLHIALETFSMNLL